MLALSALLLVCPRWTEAQQPPQLVGVLDATSYLSYTGFQPNIHLSSPCDQAAYSGGSAGDFSGTKSQVGNTVSASVDLGTRGLTNANPMTVYSSGGLTIYALGPTGTHVTLTGTRSGQTTVQSSGATVSATASGAHLANLPGGQSTVTFNDPLSLGPFVTSAQVSCNGRIYSYVTFIDLNTNVVVNNNCNGTTCGTAQAMNSVSVSAQSPTGTISVTTNLSGASFSVTGPGSYNGGGISFSVADAPAGTYTTTFAAVTGYLTPPPQTQTLIDGGVISFAGSYTQTLSLGCPAATGQANTPYASAFSAGGGIGAYASFSVATGSLPQGLTLSASGSVTGTPSKAGSYSFAGSVTDSSGATATSPSCNITVAPPPCSFTIFPTMKSYGRDGGVDSVSVTASDAQCSWVVVSNNADWLHVLGAGMGLGNDLVNYSVDENPSGEERNGTMTIAGQTFNIKQAAECGDPDLDAIITEYKPQANGGVYPFGVCDSAFPGGCNRTSYSFTLFAPRCENFTNTDPPLAPHFSLSQLKSPDAVWAILRQTLQNGLEAIQATQNISGFINAAGGRAYSTPSHNVQVNDYNLKQSSGSRHMLGDAVDIETTSIPWDTIYAAARVSGACLEPKDTKNRVHVDWRGATCPSNWEYIKP